MRLKNYQEKALDWLSRYYDRCRELADIGDSFPMSTAFTSTTGEIYGSGLPYSPVAQLPGFPYVCLRIPTGGGKTLVGCESIAIAKTKLLQTDHALVLWLVPSDAIRRQTLDRLKDRKDPYRISLETKLGSVEVLDIEEAMSVTRALLEESTVVLVATMQAFRRKEISGLNVYKNNGALMSHFEKLPSELLPALELKEEGNYDYSLVNVFRLRRPFIIVDEAHNARQPLAFETLKRLNPSGILELTATPNTKRVTVTYEGEQVENPPSNVLFSVSAYALKAEEMIKLPIYLRYREPWDALLGDAIALLDDLKGEAEKEKAETGEYIRPIMLLQAHPHFKDKESITVDTVKRTLIEQFGIPAEQVAVATGDVRDLDKPENQDVLSPTCKLRFIITVQALKEGWDCPFAYVLYSVAELSSGRAVEQILGRILRMPRAKRKEREPLNCSYAFVASTKFDVAARALRDGLIEAGFERQEASALVIDPTLPFGDAAEDVTSTESIELVLTSQPVNALPMSLLGAVNWEAKTKTLRLEQPLNPEQEAALVAAFSGKSTKAAITNLIQRRRMGPGKGPLSPSQRSLVFEVPVLALKDGGLFRQFEEDDIDELMSWSLSEADANLSGFLIPTERRDIRIDITDAEKLQQEFLPVGDAQMQLLESSTAWPVGKLVNWLDRSFYHPDLTEAETGIYLTRIVGKLIEDRKISAESLTAHRYRLAKAVEDKIRSLRREARREAMETLLFADGAAVFVTAAATHRFDPTKYPYTLRYTGLPLPKHYYEVIGDLRSEGEEYDCARTIAQQEGIKFWIRNLEREPECSFWIQTSTDKFYPDFVCKLTNGKYLVVEYKAATWGDAKDNEEKERLGQLWAARSKGRCLFLMVKGRAELSNIGDTIRKSG